MEFIRLILILIMRMRLSLSISQPRDGHKVGLVWVESCGLWMASSAVDAACFATTPFFTPWGGDTQEKVEKNFGHHLGNDTDHSGHPEHDGYFSARLTARV